MKGIVKDRTIVRVFDKDLSSLKLSLEIVKEKGISYIPRKGYILNNAREKTSKQNPSII